MGITVNHSVKSIEDLDVRALNILQYNFGSIERLLEYYKKNGGFLKLRNTGNKINDQLVSLCEYFISDGLNFNKNEIDSVNYSSNFLNEIKLEYEILKSNLSRRALNILIQVEGESNKDVFHFISLLKSGKIDFKSVRNCGQLTKDELTEFVEKISEKFKIRTDLVSNSDLKLLNHSEIEKLESIIYKIRNSLSQRALKVFNSLLVDYQSEIDVFYNQLIYGDLNFIEVRNCGLKTELELRLFAKQIQNAFFNQNENHEEVSLLQNIYVQIKSVFPEIPSLVFPHMICDEELNLFKLVFTAIYYYDFKPTKQNVIRELFRDESDILHVEIAQKCNITRERVRQILTTFYEKNLVEIVEKVIQLPVNFVSLQNQNKIETFIKVNNIDVSYLDHGVKLNRELLFKVTKLLYSQSHKSCSDLYIKIKTINNALDVNTLKWEFVSIDFIEEVKFIDFLEWVDVELFNFGKLGNEFDLDVLIFRYFQTFNIPINKNWVNELTAFVNRNKFDFSNTVVRRKGLREARRNEIISICRLHIEQSISPVKTTELISILFNHGIGINKQELLMLLNKRRDVFLAFGLGVWTLSSLKTDNVFGGSLRDMVLKMLEQSEIPLHVSEILTYINQFRKVSFRSLQTNLKTDVEEMFVFFNCNFIGLKLKKYDKSWFELPKVNGLHFGKVMLDKALEISHDIPELYLQKYNYPKVNTQFLIESKK